LVIETSLYYDSRSEKHQITYIVCSTIGISMYAVVQQYNNDRIYVVRLQFQENITSDLRPNKENS